MGKRRVLHFGGIQRLAYRATSASDELLVQNGSTACGVMMYSQVSDNVAITAIARGKGTDVLKMVHVFAFITLRNV